MKAPKKRPTPAQLVRQPLRVAKHLYHLPDLQYRVDEMHELFLTLNHVVRTLGEEDKKLHVEDEDLKHRLELIDQRLSDVVHQLTIMNEQRSKAASAQQSNNFKNDDVSSDLVADDHLLDNFYVEFEHWFRGTDAEIKQRQKVYLPLFAASKIDSKKYPMVDIGCGRGEFVQLLKENGVRGIGLDLNKAMVDHARDVTGVEAEQGDALTYLREQKTNSIMAITGFHIVEHIPFLDLVRIFDECYRVLRPGGFVIFETPNPENVIVGTCNFWSDPSHLHPIPPAFLDFTLKTRGFAKTEVKRLHPIKNNIDSKDPLVREMAERMYGPQDYSVIATK